MNFKILNRGFFYRGEKGERLFKPFFLVCPSDHSFQCVGFETYDDANSYGKLAIFLFKQNKEKELYNLLNFYIVEQLNEINQFIIKLDKLLNFYRKEIALIADLEIYKEEEEANTDNP